MSETPLNICVPSPLLEQPGSLQRSWAGGSGEQTIREGWDNTGQNKSKSYCGAETPSPRGPLVGHDDSSNKLQDLAMAYRKALAEERHQRRAAAGRTKSSSSSSSSTTTGKQRQCVRVDPDPSLTKRKLRFQLLSGDIRAALYLKLTRLEFIKRGSDFNATCACFHRWRRKATRCYTRAETEAIRKLLSFIAARVAWSSAVAKRSAFNRLRFRLPLASLQSLLRERMTRGMARLCIVLARAQVRQFFRARGAHLTRSSFQHVGERLLCRCVSLLSRHQQRVSLWTWRTIAVREQADERAAMRVQRDCFREWLRHVHKYRVSRLVSEARGMSRGFAAWKAYLRWLGEGRRALVGLVAVRLHRQRQSLAFEHWARYSVCRRKMLTRLNVLWKACYQQPLLRHAWGHWQHSTRALSRHAQVEEEGRVRKEGQKRALAKVAKRRWGAFHRQALQRWKAIMIRPTDQCNAVRTTKLLRAMCCSLQRHHSELVRRSFLLWFTSLQRTTISALQRAGSEKACAIAALESALGEAEQDRTMQVSARDDVVGRLKEQLQETEAQVQGRIKQTEQVEKDKAGLVILSLQSEMKVKEESFGAELKRLQRLEADRRAEVAALKEQAQEREAESKREEREKEERSQQQLQALEEAQRDKERRKQEEIRSLQRGLEQSKLKADSEERRRKTTDVEYQRHIQGMQRTIDRLRDEAIGQGLSAGLYGREEARVMKKHQQSILRGADVRDTCKAGGWAAREEEEEEEEVEEKQEHQECDRQTQTTRTERLQPRRSQRRAGAHHHHRHHHHPPHRGEAGTLQHNGLAPSTPVGCCHDYYESSSLDPSSPAHPPPLAAAAESPTAITTAAAASAGWSKLHRSCEAMRRRLRKTEELLLSTAQLQAASEQRPLGSLPLAALLLPCEPFGLVALAAASAAQQRQDRINNTAVLLRSLTQHYR